MKKFICFAMNLIFVSVLTGCASFSTIKRIDQAPIIIPKDSVITQDYRGILSKSFTIVTKISLANLPSEANNKRNIEILGGKGMCWEKEGCGVALSFYKVNNCLYFDTYNGTTRRAIISKFSEWIPDVSYVITAVNDQKKGKKQLYINNVLEFQQNTFTNDVYWGKDVPFTVNYGKYPELEIDDVYIFDRALSSNEVVAVSASLK